MPEIANGAATHLFYEDHGSGPAVLLSHSWFCDGRQWPQVEAVTGAGFRALNLDNRGHGRSGPHHTPFATWDMAEDLIAVLDDAGVADAVLVGLSIGEFAAIRAALRHPSCVRALVLADTSAGPRVLEQPRKDRGARPPVAHTGGGPRPDLPFDVRVSRSQVALRRAPRLRLPLAPWPVPRHTGHQTSSCPSSSAATSITTVQGGGAPCTDALDAPTRAARRRRRGGGLVA